MGMKGRVYLVGAGPGDEGLITVKGKKLLRECDCVVYDSLISEKLLDEVREGCERIFVGKRKGCHSCSQEEINEVLIRQACRGKMVVRLKGGDPFVFGRGGEEALALQKAGIAFAVVPGVSSAIAVPALAGIPVTHRKIGRSLHIFTGHTEMDGGVPKEIYQLGSCGGTVVCLMGLSHLGEIAEGLLRQGWKRETPAAVIQQGTLPGQREVFGTLETIEGRVKEAGLKTPAVIVVGETAGLRLRGNGEGCLGAEGEKEKEEKGWSGPLVGITGTPFLAERLLRMFSEAGIRAEVAETLSVIPLHEEEMRSSYAHLGEYTWLVFTSANGVRRYFQGFFQRGPGEFLDLRKLGGVKIAVIGPGTALALEEFYLRPDYMPRKFTGHDLGLGLAGRLGKDDRVLLPRARQGSVELTECLREAGVKFTDLPIYDVRGEAGEKKERLKAFDWLTFASASGVRAFFAGQNGSRALPPRTKLCCIGEMTARALQEFGFSPDCIAREASAEGLVKAVVEGCVQKKTEGNG